ncbi:MAG: DNRLRE domain-containing protein [Desulfobulbaceae bacterium]|nr:DNRLRE domain-containing protein [Desulfobulbaceae bacterium]
MNIIRNVILLNVILFLQNAFVSPTITIGSDAAFSWIPNSESNIEGYKIYYGTTAGGIYSNSVDINSNIADPSDGRIHGTVSELTKGTTYSFACTAYNDLGSESSFSNEVVYTAGSDTKTFGDSTNSDYPNTLTDTFINLNQDNQSSNPQLRTYTWPENTIANAILMKADLSSLPANIQIVKATLELYLIGSGGDADYDISAHKIINYNPNLTATTGYTYDTVNYWTANSCCYNNVPMAQGDIDAAEDTVTVDLSEGYKSWTITEMVKTWVEAPSTNFGLLLNADDVAGSDSFRYFASNEETDPALRPKLTITYIEMVFPRIITTLIK